MPDNNKELQNTGLAVIMISSDPAFGGPSEGMGDALERHRRYASFTKSLDIVVLGGRKRETRRIDEKLTIHLAGRRGMRAILPALRIAYSLCAGSPRNLVVTQDPHASGWIGAKLKKKFSLPLIMNLHGDFWNNPVWVRERFTHTIKNYLQKRLLPQADGIRVVSDGIRQSLLGSGFDDRKIIVVHTPVNDAVFTRFSEEQQILLEKLKYKFANQFVILFTGRLVAAKNLRLMLDAVDQLRKRRSGFSLIIIGEGEERPALEAFVKAKRLEQTILFMGAQSQERLSVYYRFANVLLLLSTNESFGKVIIEAGLVGTPTLASATTGASSIIGDGVTGFLVPINDVHAAVDVLDEMMEQPEQTKQLGIWASEKYRERYASETTVQKIILFWKKIGTQS